MHVMIFGCGYSGTAIAKAFASPGVRITGTTRSAEKAALLAKEGIEAFVFDGETLDPALAEAMASATHLVQSIAPGKSGDPLLRLAQLNLKALMPKLEWVCYLSTVGVYGDHKGAWVSEQTSLHPVADRSVERVEAEDGWLRVGIRLDLPVSVLRLSGIYGPGRNAFCNLDKGTARRLIKANQVFNRIRVEDIGACARFLSEHRLGGIYNVTDDEPAPPQDVIAEAARLMGIEPPPEQPFETAELSPMARSFYGENKRVSNAKLRALGFAFRYPEYRMSLAELWSSGRWQG
ncbi:SDR family oxidoreductase [Rhizobium lusitanum]|uniref:Nucleoside-diphosphate-sugar epimerase n=1 Tax=Rhizobium lusitanum TaxID=293958 RepID=A0A7X0MET8_9HYPH|nr:SDR family oxidoreductase [Rhizobium lusitanum]MBB6486385.1 nucleoside-diphosphate-sugar epimerase [Rhizobium lusitanum]